MRASGGDATVAWPNRRCRDPVTVKANAFEAAARAATELLQRPAYSSGRVVRFVSACADVVDYGTGHKNPSYISKKKTPFLHCAAKKWHDLSQRLRKVALVQFQHARDGVGGFEATAELSDLLGPVTKARAAVLPDDMLTLEERDAKRPPKKRRAATADPGRKRQKRAEDIINIPD
ncbi:MAG TPA: hypothetical protein VKD22_04940 [Ramlibacter sp.]|nr:hypothetical protein [Ramlibacter sp.]